MNIIIALFTILLLHHIWNYLKDNYSTKKTKDLAEFQAQKYKDMFLTLSNSSENMSPDYIVGPSVVPSVSHNNESSVVGYSSSPAASINIEWLNANEEQWMTQELGKFMNDLLVS